MVDMTYLFLYVDGAIYIYIYVKTKGTEPCAVLAVSRNFLFQETEFSYILRNTNPKKLLIFQEVTFQA